MKVKLFVIGILMLFAGIIGAQPADYHIRVDSATNLRESYSLNSAVHEKVLAGTVLHVIYEGTQGNWLQIDRNGVRVWMARWLSHSRVDAPQAQPAAPADAPDPVDNCCGVDRQCTTDAEWLAGWEDFQVGACPIPPSASPQPADAPKSSPAQAPVSIPANVDNCCYVNRTCYSDADWLAGFYAFRTDRCATVPPSSAPSSIPAGHFYEFSGDGETVIGGVRLAAGNWRYTVSTQGYFIVEEDGRMSACLDSEIWINKFAAHVDASMYPDLDIDAGSKVSKTTNVRYDCTLTLEISNVSAPWHLVFQKY